MVNPSPTHPPPPPSPRFSLSKILCFVVFAVLTLHQLRYALDNHPLPWAPPPPPPPSTLPFLPRPPHPTNTAYSTNNTQSAIPPFRSTNKGQVDRVDEEGEGSTDTSLSLHVDHVSWPLPPYKAGVQPDLLLPIWPLPPGFATGSVQLVRGVTCRVVEGQTVVRLNDQPVDQPLLAAAISRFFRQTFKAVRSHRHAEAPTTAKRSPPVGWSTSVDPAGLPFPTSLSLLDQVEAEDYAATATAAAAAPHKRDDHGTESPTGEIDGEEEECLLRRLELTVTSPDLVGLGPGIDESYHLSVSAEDGMAIVAPTPWGIVRGLESLSQLIEWRDTAPSLGRHEVHNVPLSFHDGPATKHRGLLLDTARHFHPPRIIRRVIDGLAALKYNVLHWHLTDAQSFPLLLDKLPQLASSSAWDVDQVYDLDTVRQLVLYGYVRGIRVIPEFDIPGHADAWTRVFPNTSSRCELRGDHGAGADRARAERIPLNPAEPFSVTLVATVVCEAVSNAFMDPYVHFGADELPLDCWKQDPRLAERMRRTGETPSQVWGDFLAAVRAEVAKCMAKPTPSSSVGRTLTSVFWDELASDSVAGAFVQNGSVAQVWRTWGGNADRPARLAAAGWPVIYSGTTPLYLDSPRTWQALHKFRLSALPGRWTDAQRSRLLGAEACLWSEHINAASLLPSLFPSMSALSEALWSADVPTDDVAEARLSRNVCFLLKRGVWSGPVQPGPC